MSPYLQSDYLGIQVARWYANEYKIPFYAVTGDFPAFDVASIDDKIRLELKKEESPKRTGLVCLEYFNPQLGIPSGILRTEATHWLHFLPENNNFIGYEFKIDAVRKLAIETGMVKSNGINSVFKLIPIETFKQNAERRIDLGNSPFQNGGVK